VGHVYLVFHALKYTLLAATLIPFTATFVSAASCPADAPEGYKWLSGYVEEYKSNGTISSWFTDSLAQNPTDVALLGLQAFFDAKGDVDAARQVFKDRGGFEEAFAISMACSGIE